MLALVVIAVIAGGVVSYYLAVIRMKQAVIVVTHARFYLSNSYFSLYERLQSHYSYELLGSRDRFGSFAKYATQHDRVGRTANQRFKKLYGVYSAKTIRDYGLCLIASLVLFWPVWVAFIITFLAVQVIYLTYLRVHQNYNLDTLTTLVYGLVLDTELLVLPPGK